MTVELYDGTNFDGLFDLLGKAFFAQSTIQTAVGTTIPPQVLDAIAQFKLRTSDNDIEGVEDPLTRVNPVIQAAALSGQNLIRQYASALVTAVVDDDATLSARTLQNALIELIDQMETGAESVDASTVTASAAAGGSNTTNGVVVVSHKRGDGRPQENMLAEAITVAPVSNGFSVSLLCTGNPSVPLLAHNWPQGSGIAAPIQAAIPSASLLANGDFEDEDDVANVPDDWEVVLATIGTTLKMTDVEVQTLTIAGTPTSGHYLVHWTDPDGNAWTTAPIAYNATAAVLQTALRKFGGLSAITVTATGTAPNYTHTITFVGKGGNVAQFTATNNLDTGTVTPATGSAGTAQVFEGGKAVEFDSDGAQLTQIRQRLNGLTPSTAYALSLWAICDSVPAAGVFTIDLVDGSGSVIADDQSVNNSMTFNAADLTTSWQHLDALVSGDPVFRTPAIVPAVVYLRLRISTAMSNTTSAFFDAFAMTAMTELYPGGPLAAAFAGSVAFDTNDRFTITTTNDRAGAFQEWFHRNFNMAQLGLLLPSDTGGSETVADSLIS